VEAGVRRISVAPLVGEAEGVQPSAFRRAVIEPAVEITNLLQAWAQGDQGALEKLMPAVMEELRRLARSYLRRERAGHTLQTTALINEAYIKLAGQNRAHWQNRSHFFAIAAQCMRRILIDYAKTRRRQKRGGMAQQVSLPDHLLMSAEQSEELLALDAALKKLATQDERKSKIVELRYFGAYSMEEIAEILNLSEITVARDRRLVRAWLLREISGS
jgi:RNA polymerase sigma factor (TIGR02999 family)